MVDGEVGEIMLCALGSKSMHYVRQRKQQQQLQQRQFRSMRKNIISIQRIIRDDSSYEFALTASVHTTHIIHIQYRSTYAHLSVYFSICVCVFFFFSLLDGYNEEENE